jgi:hypothetical protein
VLFLIEGAYPRKNAVSQTAICGAVLNMLFNHCFSVLKTDCEADTFTNLVMMYKKFAAKDFSAKEQNTTAPLKLVSKSDKIKGSIMAIQLSAVPGLSFQASQVVAKLYPSMHALIGAYHGCETKKEKELLLSSLPMTDKRKLGPALSKKIYNAVTHGSLD